MKIGLLGTILSGKTTASNYLVKKSFYRVIMGDLVREATRKEGLEPTRENLQKVQEKYRKKYGKSYFINLAIKKLKASKRKKLLIDGIRLPTDARIAKKFGAKLIFIDAPIKIRFERMKARAREGEEKKSFEEFKKEEKKEWKIFDFRKTIKYADYKIVNDGTLKEFYKKINELIKK